MTQTSPVKAAPVSASSAASSSSDDPISAALQAAASTAPPEILRVTRGSTVWSNGAPWPAVGNAERLPFRIGVIVEDSDESWAIFGVPDPNFNAKGEPTPIGHMIKGKNKYLVAKVPFDPAGPVSESVIDAKDAIAIVTAYRADAQVAWAESWLGEDEDEPETAS